MAEIIDFATVRAAYHPPNHGAMGPAQILLFLGVRYERHSEKRNSAAVNPDNDSGKTPPRPRRRRAS